MMILDACGAVSEEDYLPLVGLAALSGYASTHLGRLIRQGRLAEVKRGGRWYSTQTAIERYHTEVDAADSQLDVHERILSFDMLERCDVTNRDHLAWCQIVPGG